MRLRATLSQSQHAAGSPADAHLVISLHGEDTADTHRPDVAVIPVVDRSGSMSFDRKLSTVTAALTHLASLLGPTDRVALVAFDDRTTTWPLRAADTAGVAAFTGALRSLTPRGSTNLEGAIQAALVEGNRTKATTLTRVIVLTDGRANRGATTQADLVATLSERADHVSVSFLGVGTDCDHALLGALAEAGGGTYGFIETADDAPAILGAEVGGLLDAEARAVSVVITPNSSRATLAADAPLGGAPATTRDGVMTVDISSVLRGVTRNLVIPLTLTAPKRPQARPVTIADVHVVATIDDQSVEHTLKPKVHFAATCGAADPELAQIVELAQVAEAIRTARTHADAGDFAAARTVVGSVSVSSRAASGLLRSAAGSYASAPVYAASAGNLSSTVAAVGGRLAGSSSAFDALAAATLGSYRSEGQLDVAEATTAAVTRTRTQDPAPTENAGDDQAPVTA